MNSAPVSQSQVLLIKAAEDEKILGAPTDLVCHPC